MDQRVTCIFHICLAWATDAQESNKEFSYYILTNVNWDSANQICGISNATLANLETQEDLTKAWNNAPVVWPYWTSASDNEPGDFTWGNGNPLFNNSSMWAAKEPNDFGADHKTCVTMSGGKLFTERCTWAWYVVCEKLIN
ncbi:uncharacterized protein LOC135935232 [Cloeon dipterum]|uniref:uncharacterized protein LOC135935232 n=1 Tax=Cloeon dipterum TaxID=197152 RepID=UPI00321FF0B1